MTWLNILYMIIGIVATLLSTVLPVGVKLVKSIKAYNAAKTEAEAEKAYNDMLTHAHSLIEAAEVAFEGYDRMMKDQGKSAGAMKKKDVTSQLQVYALTHGYAYDAEYWSTKIDDIVKFTREVNSGKESVKVTTASNDTSANVMRKY